MTRIWKALRLILYGMTLISAKKKITKIWNMGIDVILAWIMILMDILMSNFKLKALIYLVENILQNKWICKTVSDNVGILYLKSIVGNIGNFFMTLYCLLVMYFDLYFCKEHIFYS